MKNPLLLFFLLVLPVVCTTSLSEATIKEEIGPISDLNIDVQYDPDCLPEARDFVHAFVDLSILKVIIEEGSNYLGMPYIEKVSSRFGRELTKEEMAHLAKITKFWWEYLQERDYLKDAMAEAISLMPCEEIIDALEFAQTPEG